MISRAVAVLATALLALASASLPAQESSRRPRLAVLVVFDQLASHVLEAAEPHLGDGGFRRLRRRGTDFVHCRFRHATTYTGPGHATLGTGADPSDHGIIGNSWGDPETAAAVYCVADPEARPVGGPGTAAPSPRNLLAMTLGDTMKVHLGPEARVVSLSWKDRAAILMGGRSADLATWFDKSVGRFVSSTWYGEALPEWLRAFNERRPADRLFGATWDRFGPESAYEGLVDDRKYEFVIPGSPRTLPKTLDGGGKEKPDAAFYRQLYAAPQGNELLLEAALAAIDGAGLGRDDTPDLLCVSFSCNDVIGHFYGPGSVEVRDVTLRSDDLVRRLLDELDRRFGQDGYLVALSADHGVAPIPEGLTARRLGGRGALFRGAAKAANRALVAAFGEPPEGFRRWVKDDVAPYLIFDGEALAKAGVDRRRAQDVAAAAAATVPGVGRAVARWRALAGEDPADALGLSIRRAMHPLRSGDVFVCPAPYWIDVGDAIPATHGAPYPYDQEVPLLVAGPGIARGHRSLAPTSPGAAVVLLASLLHLPTPAQASAALPVDALAR